MPFGPRGVEIEFDLREHEVRVDVSDGGSARIALTGQAVADFHAALHRELDRLGVTVEASPGPSEVPEPVLFAEQTAPGTYDRDAVHGRWTAMVSIERVIQRYRTPFSGKSSPVNFFWGGFDLNHARFNGRPHTPREGAGPILYYGENAQNVSVGFWPGDGEDPSAAVYAPALPSSSVERWGHLPRSATPVRRSCGRSRGSSASRSRSSRGTPTAPGPRRWRERWAGRRGWCRRSRVTSPRWPPPRWPR